MEQGKPAQKGPEKLKDAVAEPEGCRQTVSREGGARIPQSGRQYAGRQQSEVNQT